MASPERRNSVTKQRIDREKTTPFLLRLFVRQGGFHRLDDFETLDRLPVQDELQIYTWKDTTLSELGHLMSTDYPQVLRPNTRLAFRLLYTDSYRPRVILKDVGTVIIQQTANQPDAEDAGARTLEDVKYVIGDWIDVAIFSNTQGGPPGGPRGGSFSRQGGMGGPGERGRGRGDSYRGGGMSRGGGRMGGPGGRNGFDGPSSAGDWDERGPPGGPRRDRDRDRGGRW